MTAEQIKEIVTRWLNYLLGACDGDGKLMKEKAKSLLAEEAPIHADWKLREELGEYMDELKDNPSDKNRDTIDDLSKILANCPAVYHMDDNPAISKAKDIEIKELRERYSAQVEINMARPTAPANLHRALHYLCQQTREIKSEAILNEFLLVSDVEQILSQYRPIPGNK